MADKISEKISVTMSGEVRCMMQAYEALVEEKGKNAIYLRLSGQCVSDLGLKDGGSMTCMIQFVLNRIPHCELHQAVDRMKRLDSLFPQFPSGVLPDAVQSCIGESREFKVANEDRLNSQQWKAVLLGTADQSVSVPPILLMGPFGTGKTFTMAQTALEILQQPNTRILICTHSNSAADLYIKDYIDPYISGDEHPEVTPLRVVYRYRWTQSVHPTVLKYCLLNTDSSVSGSFRVPTLDEITKYRLVIATLSTSRQLFDIGIDQGFFTHILIDEAAQATECECLLALNLASQSTRIVLAGDHMQMNPEVYSEFACSLGLNKSLLERLYDSYTSAKDSALASLCTVNLRENYRSHKAIIDLTSELFYAGGLTASSVQPQHEDFYPLSFFTARGDDEQHVNSTAFYNNAEVFEVVDRLCELQKKWPKSWGDFDANSVGVVTPYHDQVLRIRSELRKRKLASVCVERVLNVQGKEFRVIFLSTVRTNRTTCSGVVDKEVDYGFLSNMKLLNTAITRAQSLVAVVGDPLAVCTVGNCRKFWLRYLETCHENNSLFGVTWSQLQRQLDGMELKKTYVLNPRAPEFVPNRLRHATLTGAAATATLLANDTHHVEPSRLPAQHNTAYQPLAHMQQPVSHMPPVQFSAEMPLHQLMPFQPMTPYVAAGYHNRYVAPGAHVPFVNSFSHCQSNVPVVRMPPANINPVNNVHSVPANIQNPFAGPPVGRYELPVPMRPHLMNYDMQAQQQLFHQQFLFQLAAAAGNSLLRPIAVAPIPSPSIAPQQCVPAPGIRPSPVINPVLQQQPFIPARPTNEQGIHQGQFNVRDVSKQQFVVNCTAQPSVFTKPILLPSCTVSAAVSAVSPTLPTCIATTSMHTNVQYLEQVKGEDVSKQHIVSCTVSSSICTSSLPSCNKKYAPVSSTTQTCSATTSAHINLQHSKCSEAFSMDALSVSACSTKICGPTVTTVTSTKPFEANSLPPSRNVNQCKASSLSNVKPLLSVSLPQSSNVNHDEASSLTDVKQLQSVSLPQSCGPNTYETESVCTTEQPRTSSLRQNCNTDKTEVDILLRPKLLESSSLLEVCDTVECKADCSPMNTCKEHIQTAPLPAAWNAVECQDDSHFTQKELQTAAVSESSDIVRNSAVMSDRDILHAKPWSPLGFHSGEDCRKSLETRLGSPVTGSVWPDTLVKDSDYLASFSSENSALGWVDSEADALVKSVRSIVDVERPSSKETEVNSWLSNAASQDKVWTKPADAKNIWSSATDSVCDLYSNVCHVSSTEQKHFVVGVGGPLDSMDQYDASGAETDQWTNAAEIGLHSQHDIWPTAFGPFARPSELESPPDCTCRLPPGLETQVMARFGVIGERGPQTQRLNTDVEGSDSGLELASGSSSELSVALLSSETVNSAAASVQGQPVDHPQEPSTTDSSMLLNTSQLVDVISARMAQIVPQRMDDSMLPANSDGEFKALGHQPCSDSCLPTSTSEDDSCLASDGSYSNIDTILRQPATTVCDTGTSQPASDTTEQSTITDDAVAQLLDILHKPQLLREVLDFVNSSSSASASRSTSCSSQDAEAVRNIATSGVVSSSTLSSVDANRNVFSAQRTRAGPVASGNSSVANSQANKPTKNCASGSPMDELLVLLARWKL